MRWVLVTYSVVVTVVVAPLASADVMVVVICNQKRGDRRGKVVSKAPKKTQLLAPVSSMLR